MSIVAGTRLRVRSAWTIPLFFYSSLRSLWQARGSSGYLNGRLLQDKDRAFWTVTVWSSEEDMRRYRNAGFHKGVMARAVDWCDELVTAHWSQEGAALPGWDEVTAKLRGEGRFMKLQNPSSRQQSREFPDPNTKQAIDFGPRG